MTALFDAFRDDLDDDFVLDPTQLIGVVVDHAQVDEQFERLNDRRAAAAAAATARHDAATARQVAQSFSAYGRALRKVADARGSVIDRAVDLFLAGVCDAQVEQFTAEQARYSTIADRFGSL